MMAGNFIGALLVGGSLTTQPRRRRWRMPLLPVVALMIAAVIAGAFA